jgi:hypothetical protein
MIDSITNRMVKVRPCIFAEEMIRARRLTACSRFGWSTALTQIASAALRATSHNRKRYGQSWATTIYVPSMVPKEDKGKNK